MSERTLQHYRVGAGRSIKLKDFDPQSKPRSCGDKAEDKNRILELAERIDALQELLYANQEQKLLIVLQGMDTSGKDGTVRKVFGRTDPLGVHAIAFKAPTEEELGRDFLWRVHRHVPGRGEIAIFNRSHYEDVLITRVKGWIDASEAKRRMVHINNFEALLSDTGTRLLKCFLHISKDEQKARLQARLANPAKHWKFDAADLAERKCWDDYQAAYEQVLNTTATHHAPWYIVPADSKTHRNLMVAELVVQTLEEMQLTEPQANPAYANLTVE